MTRVAWGSSFIVLALLAVGFAGLAPRAAAAGPAVLYDAPFTVDGDVTGYAMDGQGRFAAVVVAIDQTSAIPLPGQPVKKDIFAFDLTASGQIYAARHVPEVRTGQIPTTQTVAFAGGDSDPSEGHFLVGGPGNAVSRWNMQGPTPDVSEKKAETTGGSAAAVGLTSLADREIVAVNSPAGTNSRVFVYDPQGRYLWDFNTSSDTTGGTAVKTIAVARQAHIVAIGDDRGVTFIDPYAAHKPSTFSYYGTNGAVVAIDVSSDGSRFVVGTSDGTQGFLYYFTASNLDAPWNRGFQSPITTVAITNDGKRFAAGSSLGEILFFQQDASHGAVQFVDPVTKSEKYLTGAKGVTRLDYDSTGGLLVATVDTAVLGFHSSRNTPVWTVTASALGLTDTPLKGALVADSGERVLVVSKQKVNALKMTTSADVTVPEGAVKAALPGDTVRFGVQLKNTGSTPDTYTFQSSPPAGWHVDNVKQLTLLPDDSATVLVNVTAPTSAPPGFGITRLSVLSATLAAQGKPNGVKALDLNVTLARTVNIRLDASEKKLSVEKGQETTFPFTLKNLGNSEAIVNLSASQAPSTGGQWKIRFDPEQVRVPAGGAPLTASMLVTAPPDGADGDSNDVTIVARVGFDSASQMLVVARVNPQFSFDLAANVTSVTTTPGKTAFVKLTISNTGNTADTFNLTSVLTDAARTAWRATLDRDSVDVPRGEKRTVTLTIKGTVREPAEGAVSVTGVSQGSGQRQTVTVTMEQVAAIASTKAWYQIPAPTVPLALAAALAVAALLALRRKEEG